MPTNVVNAVLRPNDLVDPHLFILLSQPFVGKDAVSRLQLHVLRQGLKADTRKNGESGR
jgi:hypothetical protein